MYLKNSIFFQTTKNVSKPRQIIIWNWHSKIKDHSIQFKILYQERATSGVQGDNLGTLSDF